MTVTVLMVAEKPSICTAIATALSGGSMQSHGRSPPVHEFHGKFRGKDALFRVTAVAGHIFSCDFPGAYQNWDAVDPKDLFTAPVLSVPEAKGIIKHLEREARGVEYLVLWLDCDREGENICFEVIRCVESSMRKLNEQQIFRAKFSAVTVKDIDKAMKSLGTPNENESKAVEARQELDLKIGVAFSRFQTRYFQGRYGDLDSAVISYGPCQTPTLGFCVDRHDEIKTFAPEPFWTLDVAAEMGKAMLQLEWNRGRLFDEDIAVTFQRLIQADNRLTCTSVTTNESRRVRPQAMNTVTLLKLASKNLGIGPQSAMRAAEHLYLSGYLSYPRTESTAYPSSFDFREVLLLLREHWSVGEYANNLMRKYSSPRAGHDAGDHPPITPVGLARGLSGDEERIYDLVVRHFLASISGDMIFEVTKANFVSVSGELFTIKGKREIDPGFTRVLVGHHAPTEDEDDADMEEAGACVDLPAHIVKGCTCTIASVKVRKGQTRAPGYLTESELIGLMEKHGIGTDASIPTHINNICVRNYVSLGPGRTLVPTTLGVLLVHGYLRIDPDLVMPDVRAAIESFCNQIAQGTATKEEVVAHSLRNFATKFVYFTEHIGAMDSLFEASFSPLASTGKFLSKCGKCLRYMRYIPLKPQRLYCPFCEDTYALPQNGTIKLYKEMKCPLDQFELVLFSLGNTSGAQGKSYPLCPFCYNHPPHFNIEEASGDNDTPEVTTTEGKSVSKSQQHGKMGCNQCQHPTCKHSAISLGICECPGSDDKECSGMLILDVNSKPNWKLACNECNTLIRFHANIYNIVPVPRQYCDCGTRICQFEFNNTLKSPLPSGEFSYEGCIACDDALNGMTESMVGRTVHLTVIRRNRHKRGGGGRRGRGRGRGRGRSSGGDLKMSFADF